MAFMAMKKNLDERARKKAFDEIFEKFDRNKNGYVKVDISSFLYFIIFLKALCSWKILFEKLTIR